MQIATGSGDFPADLGLRADDQEQRNDRKREGGMGMGHGMDRWMG